VSPGDVVCDIQTDKAVMSLEVDEEGILAKIIKPADSGSIKVHSKSGSIKVHSKCSEY
jgi:pyruvate/2-oxoglutarate dehydrogenase complex dihydrolipoamide acyltransferase (E2) component